MSSGNTELTPSITRRPFLAMPRAFACHAFLALTALACVPGRAVSTAEPAAAPAPAQPQGRGPAGGSAGLDEFEQQMLWKRLTDLSFFQQLGGEMLVRKIRYAGADDLMIPAYFFAPRDTSVLRPVVLLVHGGVHGDFETTYVPQVRALVAQGYVIVAPEYRGSTGYGRSFYDAIDYGGKEVEDVIAARDYLAQLVPYADTSRIGLHGWSHGGFISLHAAFRRPELFKVVAAHVPVADLVARMRNKSERYNRIFAEQPGFGALVTENPRPYIERSPSAHARKLRVPTLVHVADNDDDVFIEENHILRDSMEVAGMIASGMYTYREWHRPPAGHAFSRVDTPQGRDSWTETVAFLNRRLRPDSLPRR
jgi:dipeptidyl aminopeptidase/acylaminoacyl peptidase